MLVITACQAKQPIDDNTLCPIDESSGEDQQDCDTTLTDDQTQERGYPVVDAATGLEEDIAADIEAAYPITETDLERLIRSWQLTSYAENDVESEPPYKTLTFNSDGSYTIATETELEQGTWTTILSAMDSILILDPGTDEVRYYQIIDLGENLLNLRTQIGDVQLDEGYLLND